MPTEPIEPLNHCGQDERCRDDGCPFDDADQAPDDCARTVETRRWREMTHYLKWTRRGRIPSYQQGAPIPYRKWTPVVSDPVICERGWHACRWEDAIHHISDELWICDLGGTVVADGDKVASDRLRIVRRVKPIDHRSLRHFAADCAERVLPLFEREHPGDDRPRKAIEAARLFADGEISAAARAAASGAASAAARAAARDAAWTAASGAAWTAASGAVWDAARDAAREWQTGRLLGHYGGLNPDDFTHAEVR